MGLKNRVDVGLESAGKEAFERDYRGTNQSNQLNQVIPTQFPIYELSGVHLI